MPPRTPSVRESRRGTAYFGATARWRAGFASFGTNRFVEERNSSPVRGTCRRYVSLDVARRGAQLATVSPKLSAA